MKRIVSSLALCVAVSAVMAQPAFLAVFTAKYKIAAGSKLGKAKCLICHSTGKNRNAYGKDLEAALGSSKKMTPEILAKVEGLDSTKSGTTNGAKIKADKLPGVK